MFNFLLLNDYAKFAVVYNVTDPVAFVNYLKSLKRILGHLSKVDPSLVPSYSAIQHLLSQSKVPHVELTLDDAVTFIESLQTKLEILKFEDERRRVEYNYNKKLLLMLSSDKKAAEDADDSSATDGV